MFITVRVRLHKNLNSNAKMNEKHSYPYRHQRRGFLLFYYELADFKPVACGQYVKNAHVQAGVFPSSFITIWHESSLNKDNEKHHDRWKQVFFNATNQPLFHQNQPLLPSVMHTLAYVGPFRKCNLDSQLQFNKNGLNASRCV